MEYFSAALLPASHYLKELRDEPVDIKQDIDERGKIRMPWETPSRNADLERLEKAIEEVERKRAEQRQREREARERRRDDWDRYDPWGRF